jgi:DNA modification methylase
VTSLLSSLERVATEDLTLHPDNARRGDVGTIAHSLAENGMYSPLVVQRSTSYVLAGNHTLMAARQLGWTEVDVVYVDVDDERATRIMLSANRTADLGGYDDALLLELLQGLPDLEGTGYDDDALRALEAAVAEEAAAAGGGTSGGASDPDEVPDPPAEPVSRPGDVWLLGPHRLVVGDATDPAAHDALLVSDRPAVIYTDPPYGMNLQTDYTKLGHGRGKRHDRVIGDDRPFDAAPIIEMYDDVREQFWWGADYYRTTIPSGGSWVVWDKRANDGDMKLDDLFGAAFELCWSRRTHKREIARVLWAMAHGTHVAGEDARRGLHPTQKPVGLGTWFLERYSRAGDLVADFYAGSGSTLIACHQTGRRARLIELDPRYADVICRRYQEHTGTVPTRNGQEHDFTAEPAEASG